MPKRKAADGEEGGDDGEDYASDGAGEVTPLGVPVPARQSSH